jgi:Lipocalin-like domain
VSAGELSPLVGSWRLVSVEATFTDTGERVATFGSTPNGRVTVTRAGRIMFLITKSDRQPAADDAARAALFNEAIAYSGQVRLAGPGQLVTTVEISLFPEEVGTEKLRLFKIDGDRLIITRPEQTSRVTKGRLAVSNLIWRREDPGHETTGPVATSK